jgi:DNA-binding response OmpR family regulator
MKQRVLVIEGEESQQNVFEDALLDEYEVDTASNGGRGLDYLSSNTSYNLVLLNPQLPDMSGLDVLRYIRTIYTRYDLPVILLSGLNQSEAIVAGLEAGANDYLTKLGDTRVLLARIKVSLLSRESFRTRLTREQRKVMQETIGAACHHIAQPMTAALTEIEVLVREEEERGTRIVPRLRSLLNWMQKCSREIHRLSRVTEYKTITYTGNKRILDIANEEREAREIMNSILHP